MTAATVDREYEISVTKSERTYEITGQSPYAKGHLAQRAANFARYYGLMVESVEFSDIGETVELECRYSTEKCVSDLMGVLIEEMRVAGMSLCPVGDIQITS